MSRGLWIFCIGCGAVIAFTAVFFVAYDHYYPYQDKPEYHVADAR